MIASRNETPTSIGRFQALRSWNVPAGTIGLGIVAIVAVHTGAVQFSAKPSGDFLVLLTATQLLVVSWIWFFSRLRPDRRLIAMAAFVAVQTILGLMLRLDGFTGDGRPRWTWRWIATSQHAFEVHRRYAAREAAASHASAIDLSRTSKFDYPAFRGADRTGCATPPPLSTQWQANPPRLVWRQPIGDGWSSFAIVGDHCVTQEQRDDQEATVCYELATGQECWAHLEPVRFDEPTSGAGPRATPTIHQGRVYSLGATGILNCLAGSTGGPIWTVDILADNSASNRLFGVAGSPLVVGNLVIVTPGGNGSSVAAYDLETGQRIWRAGCAAASYSSPQFAHLGGRELVLDFNADGLFAHDLISGKLEWSTPWVSNPTERNNVCQPVVWKDPTAAGSECVFISSGYGMGSTLLDIRRQDGRFTAISQWTNRHLKAKFSSVVVHQGYVYGLDGAILTCLDLSSGERRWKGGRYGYGQLLLSGDLLLVQLESGEIAIVEASSDAFRERGRFSALADRTWNHPALAGRFLVVRNDREAACYVLPIAIQD
jgi:outer membrane protein assembly factor BamB